MRLPTVIDNETHVLAEVLRAALAGHVGGAVDVATAYFNVGGFAEVKTGLGALGHLRLLLGAEPQGGADVGLVPRAQRVCGLLEVRPGGRREHRIVTHGGLPIFTSTSFDCGHGRNSVVKIAYGSCNHSSAKTFGSL